MQEDGKRLCCFVGQRKLPLNRIAQIMGKLNQEIDNLIEKQVTDFISSGELGFDQMAVLRIIAKKEENTAIRLIFVLPYENHDESWTKAQREAYRATLGKADEIVYMSERFHAGCLKEREAYIIEKSAYCICALEGEKSETTKMVDQAKERGITVINLL